MVVEPDNAVVTDAAVRSLGFALDATSDAVSVGVQACLFVYTPRIVLVASCCSKEVLLVLVERQDRLIDVDALCTVHQGCRRG